MKYLIDSLQSYETGHGDALSPIRSEADQSFMGDHVLVKPVTTDEFRTFTATLLEAIHSVPTTLTHPQARIPQHHIQATLPANIHFEITGRPLGHQTTTHPDTRLSNTPEPVPVLPKLLPLPGVSIPDLGHAPDAWRKAIRQWEEPDPSTGYALKDWPVEWYTGVMRLKTGAKRSNRKLIAEEYQR
jgi:hypothetical protein